VLDIRVEREACSLNLAPTASTTAMLAMGDALAIALLERHGFKEEDFALLHPGGRLGTKLQRVEDLMHTGDQLPCVSPGTKMPDVIYEMSRKGMGLTTVVEDSHPAGSGAGRLVGVITDGDLRRLMQKRKKGILELTAAECMSKNPTTVSGDELAGAALHLMEERKITSILVVDSQRRLQGVIHVHDLWTTQLF
ncbi:MAG: CBS domain-containing protein, partial [Candidatus Acidiferrales bacterium]